MYAPPDGAIFETAYHLHGAREVARSVRAFLERHHLDDQTLSDWELATTEAAMNAVEHRPGHLPSDRDMLRVLVNVWPDVVEVCVDDQNTGFSFPKSPQLPDDESEGGRGLFIIANLTDSAHYVRGASGNTLVMRRVRRNNDNVEDVQRGDSLEATLDMMTEELGTSYECLSSIFRFCKDFGETEDMTGCITLWLHELLRITGASWFLMRKFHEDENSLRVLCSSGMKVPEAAEVLYLTEDAPESVETRAARQRIEVLFDDCTSHALKAPLIEIFHETVSGISYPVQVSGLLFGVLTLGCHTSTCKLKARDTRMTRIFADFLAIQLSHTMAQQEAASARMLQHDIAIAAEIQRLLLPRTLPVIPGFTCAAMLHAAQSVGGDFYDVLPLAGQGTLLVIADVMGKGPAAALFAIMFRTHLHMLSSMAATPGVLLSELNHRLYEDLDNTDMFVSAQLASLDLPSGSVTIASAGHCPALIVDRRGRQLIEARCEGPPLGVDPEAEYGEITLDEQQNCHLLMITDGITDARNPKGEMLGMGPVVTCLMKHATQGGNATQLRESILTLITDHVQQAPAADDMTLLVLSREVMAARSLPAARPETFTRITA